MMWIQKKLQLSMPHEKVTNEYIEDGGKVTQYELYWSLDEID